jgi:hypothetical protein
MTQPKPRRRVDDPPEIDMAPVREENRDIWARAEAVFNHYKIAWAFWGLFAAVVGWGFRNVKEPLEAVPVLQAQNVKIIARLDTADQDRKDISRVLKIFGRILCTQVTPSDRYKYDIDCSRLPPPELPTKGEP